MLSPATHRHLSHRNNANPCFSSRACRIHFSGSFQQNYPALLHFYFRMKPQYKAFNAICVDFNVVMPAPSLTHLSTTALSCTNQKRQLLRLYSLQITVVFVCACRSNNRPDCVQYFVTWPNSLFLSPLLLFPQHDSTHSICDTSNVNSYA